MAEEIGFENGRNSNFQGLVTMTLDPAIRHTVVHHSSTSTCPTYSSDFPSASEATALWRYRSFFIIIIITYIPNFIEIEETLWTDGRTDVWPDGHFPPYIIRSTFGSRPKNEFSRSFEYLKTQIHALVFQYYKFERFNEIRINSCCLGN